MSDAPSRLLDDSPRGVSARLLGAARRETAPASSRLRALQVASASAGLTAAGAIGAARVVRGVAFRAWMGIFGGVVVAASVAVVLVTRKETPRTNVSVASHASASTPGQGRSSEAPTDEAPAIVASSPEPSAVASSTGATNEKPAAAANTTNEAPTPPPKADVATTSSIDAPIPAPSAMTLADEIATLDAAKHALAGGDPAGAIAVLDRYGKDVPKPHLAPEAMELRVEALHALGRDDEACALSKHFLELYPSSPLSARARSACPE